MPKKKLRRRAVLCARCFSSALFLCLFPAAPARRPGELRRRGLAGNCSALKGASVQKVYVRQLRLSHYRNYAELKQEFSASRIILTGHNGAGKTNLLEAVSLLSPGRGLRRAAYADISAVAAGAAPQAAAQPSGAAGAFAVAALLDSSCYGAVQIGTGLAAPRAGQGAWAGFESGLLSRRVRINGAPQPAEALAEYCRIIWLTPAQDGLFGGAAGERRRFLDRLTLALDTAHARRVTDYEKVMRSRNRLLASDAADGAFLAALEAQMAALGTAVAAARLEAVARLSAVAAPLFSEGGFPQALLRAEGVLENRLQTQAAIDVEEEFCRELQRNRPQDSAAGRSLIGPHRSDLLVFHRLKNMPAALCSTGEQKALLTGLILAHAHLTAELAGMTPILLLDEIAAHLDEKRRAALFAVLEDLQAQAFMTGTDKALFSALKGRAEFFSVAGGCLRAES